MSILEATTEQYGKQIEELRAEVERLKIDNQLLGNGCDHFRTRAEAAERKVEKAIERCNAAIEQGDCEASFDEFANIKQILEDK